MGAPPKTIAQQVAEATPAEQSGALSTLGTTRAITFRAKDNPPPAPYYMSPDEGLLFQATGDVNGRSFGVQGRYMLPDGRIQAFVEVYTIPATTTAKSFFLTLGECFLLSLSVNNQTSPLTRGQLYVNVQVVRGNTSAGTFLTGNLVEGYVSNGYQLFWPGGTNDPLVGGQGAIISQAVSNPAAGADWGFGIPGGQRWRIRSITALLVTSAAGSARTITLKFTDGTNLLGRVDVTATQAVSTGFEYDFMLGYGRESVVGGLAGVAAGLPDLLLGPNYAFGTTTVNLGAADQWQNIRILAELWLSP